LEKTFIRCKDCWTNDNFDISRNRIWYLSNGFETSTWASCWNTHMVLHKKMEKQHFRSNQSLVWHFEDLMVWIMYIKRDSFWDKKIHFLIDNYSVVAIINKKNSTSISQVDDSAHLTLNIQLKDQSRCTFWYTCRERATYHRLWLAYITCIIWSLWHHLPMFNLLIPQNKMKIDLSKSRYTWTFYFRYYRLRGLLH
jgi:hypothetical protein